jgi:hypothetical protein
MPLALNIKGLASGQNFQLVVEPFELSMTLMNFLISHNYRIASSCSGEGVCKKCIVNKTIVSCQIKVEDFLRDSDTVEIDYL